MTAFLPSFDTLYSSAKGNMQGLKNMQGVAKYQLEEQISKANFCRKCEKYKKEKIRLTPNEPIIAAYRNASLILDPAKAMANLQRMPADAKVSQVDKTRLESRKQEASLGKDKAGTRFENL